MHLQALKLIHSRLIQKQKIPLALAFLLATPPGPSVGIYKMKIGYKEKILKELKNMHL